MYSVYMDGRLVSSVEEPNRIHSLVERMPYVLSKDKSIFEVVSLNKLYQRLDFTKGYLHETVFLGIMYDTCSLFRSLMFQGVGVDIHLELSPRGTYINRGKGFLNQQKLNISGFIYTPLDICKFCFEYLEKELSIKNIGYLDIEISSGVTFARDISIYLYKIDGKPNRVLITDKVLYKGNLKV